MRTALFLPLLAACGSGGLAMSDLGVAPGGAQDIAYARDVIANGGVPSSTDYTVEGLLSEHSLPIAGDPCADTLCPRAAAAHIDAVGQPGGRILMQLGFATNITEASFDRPPLNLAVAIDISGSMASGGKLDTSKGALHELVKQLDSGDTMGLITYGSKAKVVEELVRMDASGRARMHDAVSKLDSGGSTAMEDGLVAAADLLRPVAGARGVEDRVFLLTDAQPNVGATGVDSFVGIARAAARDDIGLTVWGVGLDLGAELVSEMSTVRGGNAYHFTDVDSMRSRVRDDFDFMVTPIAYDLEVVAEPVADLALDASWGAPLDGARERVSFGASTLFLSRSDGGMGITFTWGDGAPITRGDAPGDLADLAMTWTEVDGDRAERRTLAARFYEGTQYVDDFAAADDLGVFLMAALIDEIGALDAGAGACDGSLDMATAEERIDEAARRLHERAGMLKDPGLLREAELMDQLLLNVGVGCGG